MKKKYYLYFFIFVFAICLTACSLKKDDVNLEKTINYSNKEFDFAQLPYINYEEIKNTNYKSILDATGKYSDTTRDFKIKWNETNTYYETELTKKLFNKISLNGKKVKLPMDFKKMGKEFVGFEKIDFTDIDKQLPINYKNSSSGYEITLLTKIPSIENSDAQKYISSVFAEDKNLCKLELAKIKDKVQIAGIITSLHPPFQSQYDLKIDGIGIGSTLNEMYDKLGTPTIHSCKDDGDKTIFYLYNSEKENITYFIIFQHSNRSKDNIDIKDNVITDVSVNYSLN